MTDPKDGAPDHKKEGLQFPSLDGLFAALSGENLAKLRLPGGIIGKIGKVFIYVAVAFPVIVWAGAFVNPWVVVSALGLLTTLSLVVMRWMLTFAERNPQAALMEGAELLIYEEKKMQIGMKAKPHLTVVAADLTYDAVRTPGLLPLSELEKPEILDPARETAPPKALQLESSPSTTTPKTERPALEVAPSSSVIKTERTTTPHLPLGAVASSLPVPVTNRPPIEPAPPSPAPKTERPPLDVAPPPHASNAQTPPATGQKKLEQEGA